MQRKNARFLSPKLSLCALFWMSSRVVLGSGLFAMLCFLCRAEGRAEPQRAPAEDVGSEGAAGVEDSRRVPPLFYLRDGGKVSGEPALEIWEVETRYGLLRVPVDDLVRIHFARRVPAELKERIEELVAQLGSPDFDAREEATAELLSIGAPARIWLEKAAGSRDEEVRSRARSLLSEIQKGEKPAGEAQEAEMEPSPDEFDVVVTRRFAIRGRVRAERIEVDTRYGPLAFDISDLIGIHFKYGERIDETVEVPGRYAVPKSWLNTRLQVFKGQRLTIRASGRMHLSNYNWTAGPQGTGRTGSFMRFPCLSLVAKIGKKGKPFLVGAAWRGRAPAGGTLYLGVVPYRNYVPTGSFKVRIEGGK